MFLICFPELFPCMYVQPEFESNDSFYRRK